MIEPKTENPWEIGCLLGDRLAEDVLLHEMTHQYLYQIKNYKGKTSHNCEEWCEEIIRIAKLMKIEIKALPVKQKRVKQPGQKTGNGKVMWFVENGHLTRQEISNFPHSIRPDGFYEKETLSLFL